MTEVGDEMLMALADGELDAETAANVQRSVDADPALRERLAAFRRSGRVAKEAFSSVINEPIPARLTGLASVTGNRSRVSASASRFYLPLGAAVAASVATFVVASGHLQHHSFFPVGQEIAGLMETMPSGETRAWPAGGLEELTVTASYSVPDGVCRTFLARAEDHLNAWRGVACRHDGRWSIDLTATDPTVVADDSAPSGLVTQSIDAFLSGIGAGDSLDETAEAELLHRG